MKPHYALCLVVLGTLLGCSNAGVGRNSPQQPTDIPVASPSPTAVEPTATGTPTRTPSPTPVPPTPTSEPLRVFVDAALPDDLRDHIMEALSDRAHVSVDTPDSADIRVGPNLARPLFQEVLAVVVPFPSLTDGIVWDDVRRFWRGEVGALTAVSRTETDPTLYVTPETLRLLRVVMGDPHPQAAIALVSSNEIIDRAWEARPQSWAIMPFDELEPRWKVLRVDGTSVLDRGLRAYPLALSFGVEGDHANDLLSGLAPAELPFTNRDESKMTSLVMTGVTAMVRATAFEMERLGVLYPAEHVRDLLREADITHISNEIPFAENCPPPDRNQQSLVFCSDPTYIELLRYVGADLIELTGNHFQDYGSEATLMTIDMYNREGWPYYGGGADLEDARRPITMTHGGNSFAFIGCNPVGPTYAWATKDSPGAAPCDYDYMHAALSRLAETVDVPIATWQYWEHYQYPATPQQELDFRAMADAGAEIVSGSQAHHPQAIEFYHGAFIHYGLGNLFFDQMWSLGTRQEMIDRHIIYDGRHISTELHTFMLENYAQPRPMTRAEREDLLTAVFAASGW